LNQKELAHQEQVKQLKDQILEHTSKAREVSSREQAHLKEIDGLKAIEAKLRLQMTELSDAQSFSQSEQMKKLSAANLDLDKKNDSLVHEVSVLNQSLKEARDEAESESRQNKELTMKVEYITH